MKELEPFNYTRAIIVILIGFTLMVVNSLMHLYVVETLMLNVVNISIFVFCLWKFKEFIDEYTDSARKSNLEFKLLNDQIKQENVTIDGALEKMFNEYDENVIASKTNLFGIITYASKAYQEMSGYTEEELLGKPHNIVRHPDMPKEAFEKMWKAIKDDKVWMGEIKNLKKDGSFYWVTAKVTPIYDEHGVKVGYTSIRHDITREKVWELNHCTNRRIKDRRVSQRRKLNRDSTNEERRVLADRRINNPIIFIQKNGRAGFISSDELKVKIDK